MLQAGVVISNNNLQFPYGSILLCHGLLVLHMRRVPFVPPYSSDLPGVLALVLVERLPSGDITLPISPLEEARFAGVVDLFFAGVVARLFAGVVARLFAGVVERLLGVVDLDLASEAAGAFLEDLGVMGSSLALEDAFDFGVGAAAGTASCFASTANRL
jgi:hypothetical protein